MDVAPLALALESMELQDRVLRYTSSGRLQVQFAIIIRDYQKLLERKNLDHIAELPSQPLL